MTTHALNSGAINAVPFPAAEQGASVIELLGTVEVECSLSGIALLLPARATTTARAATTASSKVNLGITAIVAPSAVAGTIVANYRVPTSASAAPAAAIPLTGFRIKGLMAANGSGTATTAANSLIRATRGATTAATATTAAGSVKNVFTAATATGAATASQPYALKRAFLGLTVQQGRAVVSTPSMALRFRIGGQVQASVVSGADSLRVMYFMAKTVPSAVGSANPAMKLYAVAKTVPSAVIVVVAGLRLSVGSAVALSVVTTVVPRLVIRLMSKTVAQAVAYSAAADYSITLPAPLDRQIVVPPYDRTMKVVD